MSSRSVECSNAQAASSRQTCSKSPHSPQLVKSTLEIPDRTLRRAKATASALGIPLRELVTQAVEEKLSSRNLRKDKPWLECAGELAHLHKETLRVQKIIDREFEQIEPEDRA